jgi:protein SCO1/2
MRTPLVGISRRSLITFAGLALAAGGVGFAWHATRRAAGPKSRYIEVAHGVYMLAEPEVLADFELIKHDNTPFSNPAFKDRWSFVIFGYTFCPDFCPTTLVVFDQIHRMLTQQPGRGLDVQFAMVSVDPERDTVRQLKAYVPHFNSEFIGLTGNSTMIRRLTDSIGADYEKHVGSTADNYLIDHSTAVYLINPQGRLQGIFAPPHEAADMVKGFQKIRERT